mgnify:FL=1
MIAECLGRPANVDAVRIQAAIDAGLLQRCEARPIDIPGLDAGECAAIGRALEIGAAVLVDDAAARAHAAALGLRVTGTLGVLVRARRRGLVGALGPMIDTLRAGGQRSSREAVAQALAAAGEDGPS